MPDYTTPGVYIEEIPAVGPIAGIGTSTAAFIGPTVQGVPIKAVMVTNWTQYKGTFGEYGANTLYMPYAVRGFFDNGGTMAYIVNVGAAKVEDYKAALDLLTRIDDVNIVCIPGETTEGIQTEILTHCQNMGDRFAIFDTAANSTLEQVKALRASITSDKGYAALYYPWIRVSNPSGAGTVDVPPSGHLAGIYARSDGQRGVHKAPANEFINGALDLTAMLNDTEQGTLNTEGINALRLFPGLRPIVWGARTTAPKDKTAYRYINVRRLLMFIEESLQEGLRWAVFEPNDRALWKKLERTVTEFLARVWQSGALFGKTAGEAFLVKIDDELNPPSVRALGQVVIEVAVAPVRPAEFVIIRIAMREGSAAVQEG